MTPKDILHKEYLNIIEELRVDELKGYALKKILFNETLYVQEKSTKEILKAVMRYMMYSHTKIIYSHSNKKILMVTKPWNRTDHDGYWNQFKSIFEDYDEIAFSGEKNRIGLGVVTLLNNMSKLIQVYIKLRRVSNKWQRLFLTTRICEIIAFKSFLDKLEFTQQIAICFFDGEMYQNFLMQMLKKKGLVTITNQHGQPLFRTWEEDRLNQSQILNFTCDFFLAKGEFTKEQFINAGFEAERIKVLGGLIYKKEIKKDYTEKKRFALFLDCPLFDFSTKTNLDMLNQAEELAKVLGYEYIVKLHPLDDSEKYKSYISMNCKNIIKNEMLLTDICEQIDFGVFHASAIYLDLIQNKTKAYKYESNVRFPIVKSQKDIFYSVQQLLEKYNSWKYCEVDEKENYFSKIGHLYCEQDDTPQRIRRFVESILVDSEKIQCKR